MNSNLFHNLANLLILFCGILGAPELAALLPPELAIKIAGLAAFAKLFLNGMRDGLKGMTMPQPPVEQNQVREFR